MGTGEVQASGYHKAEADMLRISSKISNRRPVLRISKGMAQGVRFEGTPSKGRQMQSSTHPEGECCHMKGVSCWKDATGTTVLDCWLAASAGRLFFVAAAPPHDSGKR